MTVLLILFLILESYLSLFPHYNFSLSIQLQSARFLFPEIRVKVQIVQDLLQLGARQLIIVWFGIRVCQSPPELDLHSSPQLFVHPAVPSTWLFVCFIG
jgi:hypothetical protein